MISESLFQRYYSDPKYSCTEIFYGMVRTAANPESRLLNLGAGPATNSKLCTLKGEVAEVVGVDIDPVVLTNGEVDSAYVIENDILPFGDNSFDIAYSDYVLEHVEQPAMFLCEVHRVLKPGGTYFFRTPNLYYYVSLAAWATSHGIHKLIANRMRGLGEDAHKPWPTFYRLNTRRTIRHAARNAGFSKIDMKMVEGHPSYLMFHALPFFVGLAYERLVNSTDVLAGLRSNIFGQLIK